jgi:hypothetical protein
MCRKGIYYGSQNFVQQMTTSLAPLFLSGLLLLGPSANHPLGIRLVGPAAALLVLLGSFVFRLYALPDEISPPSPPPVVASGSG